MGWLVRNWHLKLGALALATILYTGFVFSGSFTELTFPGVPVQAINQPNDTYQLTQQLETVNIRYRVAANAPREVNADSFSVTIDLSDYDMDRAPQPQALQIDVRSLAEGVSLLDWSPTTVSVALDELDQKQVRVVLDRGEIPAGLEIGAPQISPRQVTATGPRSQLGRVDHAVARVAIDQSGIDINSRSVTLAPVDADGREVDAVDLNPESALVDIDVRAVQETKTVAIRAVVTGAVATGFEIASITVEPAVITLRGAPGLLVEMSDIATEPISVAGISATQTTDVELVLPAGVVVADEEASSPVATIEIRAMEATRTVLLGPECINVASGLTCLPQQGQLAVRLSGSAADLEAISPASLTAALDMSGLGAGSHTVAVGIGLPNGVELISISPAAVTVVLEPPPTPTPEPSPG